MNPQTHGMEQIEGTYLFDLRTSNRALRLNRFFWHMIRALWRDRFLQDAEVLMQEADLHRAGEGADPRARLAWPGAVRCQLFVIEKFARVVRMTNLQVYAIMRGESFEDFMQTRRVPDAR